MIKNKNRYIKILTKLFCFSRDDHITLDTEASINLYLSNTQNN